MELGYILEVESAKLADRSDMDVRERRKEA